MRVSALVLLCVLLAGCASPADERAPTGENETGDAPVAEPTGPAPAAPGIGVKGPVVTERFAMQADHSLAVLPADAPEMPMGAVAESVRSSAFFEGFAQDLVLEPWTSPPFQSAWETTGDVTITMSFRASAPAASLNPRAAGFPPVGGWFGTPDRYASFVLATDAPDTLAAGQVYTVTLVATPPPGGFFVREGESLALRTFLAYQVADGSAPSYVIGGPEPAGIALPHTHFALAAPRATVLLEETGEVGPNPGPTGDMQETPAMLPFTVPADALYVVMEVAGAPKAGTRLDMDLRALSAAGERIGDASGPGAHEVVVLGPGNLAVSGRELVAQIVNAANPSGATFTLKVTAYSP